MSPADQSNLFMRREFVRLSAGIIAGLGIPGLSREPVMASDNETASGTMLDESYLEKGLTGMARSKGWFNAHLGAAVLAGYYLCKENRLDDAVVAGIKKQLDALIRMYGDQFTPFANLVADESLVEEIPAALPPAVEGGLRAHGHAVIYTALSTRALRDVPHMADPRLVGLLCGHTQEIARKKPVPPTVRSDYADTQAMIVALLDSLGRFEPLVGRPTVQRPNFTHMTTHTEALMTLETLGYPDLARAGQLGQQAHIAEPVARFDPAQHPVEDPPATLEVVMSESYWESEENQRRWNRPWAAKSNPNGSWVAFGHLFKVLYAYHRLIARIEDEDQVRRSSQVLLERYINPDVQGG